MNKQLWLDIFVCSLAVAILGLGALMLIGTDQYQTDRDNHRNTQETK